MPIKNVVFDVGNVLVRWDPLYIIQQAFPDTDDHVTLAKSIFGHPTWYNHNLGLMTEADIIQEYHQRLNIDKAQLNHMMKVARESLIPIEGSVELLETLEKAKYNLFALTDNTKPFMSYLRERYDFWKRFKGVVVSAEVGFLKPAPEIYLHLLESYQLAANETVFLDDRATNVKGAQALGIAGIRFENSLQGQQALNMLGVKC